MECGRLAVVIRWAGVAGGRRRCLLAKRSLGRSLHADAVGGLRRCSIVSGARSL